MSASTASRVVIVGASLAGLRAAQELRAVGWLGTVVIVGDEAHPPYDRPPLSKGILTGHSAPSAPLLARLEDLDVEWRLGVPATGLNRSGKNVLLADGTRIAYDQLVVATGRRARPWGVADEARLAGVFTVRTIEDALGLRTALAGRPRRVVVVGAGFIGSEVASVVRSLGLDVTVVSRGNTPLDGALGESVGHLATGLYLRNGVDFRPATQVSRIVSDDGHVAGVELDDGSRIVAEVVVVATGSLSNVEWLQGSGLDIDGGLAVDSRLRALDDAGTPCPDIFAAGDVARWAHPLAADRLLTVEHWDNAVEQGRYVARMIARDTDGGPAFAELPKFWSMMFGANIKSVGVPSLGEDVVVVQGSVEDHRGIALYGRAGRTVGAVALDSPRELVFFESLVATGAPFPPHLAVADWGGDEPPQPLPARFPVRGTARPKSSDAATRGALAAGPASREPTSSNL